MANWLNKQKIKGLGEAEVYDGNTYLDKIKGRTGIVYFEDYWPRPGESRDHGPRTGDHIDLWNKGKWGSLKKDWYPSSWARRNFGSFMDDHFGLSDFTKSKKVIFWEIK